MSPPSPEPVPGPLPGPVPGPFPPPVPPPVPPAAPGPSPGPAWDESVAAEGVAVSTVATTAWGGVVTGVLTGVSIGTGATGASVGTEAGAAAEAGGKIKTISLAPPPPPPPPLAASRESGSPEKGRACHSAGPCHSAKPRMRPWSNTAATSGAVWRGRLPEGRTLCSEVGSVTSRIIAKWSRRSMYVGETSGGRGLALGSEGRKVGEVGRSEWSERQRTEKPLRPFRPLRRVGAGHAQPPHARAYLYASLGVNPMIWIPAPRAMSIASTTSEYFRLSAGFTNSSFAGRGS